MVSVNMMTIQTNDALEVELDIARVLSFTVIVLQKRCRTVIKGVADLWLSLRSLNTQSALQRMGPGQTTHRVEENSGLKQNVAGFNKLLHALAQLLVRVVHLNEP